MEKLHAPTWTSETYLREAMGPLAPYYRDVAGDRLMEKIDFRENDAFPAALDNDWREYLNAFTAYYDLDDDQVQRANAIFDQRKSDTLSYFRSKKETVTKLAPYPPELQVEMNMKQRLDEHDRLLQRVRDIEAKFPTEDKTIHDQWKAAKADLARWRAELKKAVDAQTAKFKTIDPALKDKINKEITSLEAKLKNAKDDKETTKLKKDLEEEKAKLWAPLGDVLTSEQRAKGPVPEPARPMGSWRLLEWSDFGVKWGLIVLGGALMLGVFSRLSSAVTALLILSFYLAMPPLPGWPESPRLEGHYMLVNKTLIEVIALAALACMPTGRWAGVDGLFGLCCSKNCEA
jgi:uncharacterized membrane protein YphA (DoxX/SURF4 family)